MSLLCVNSNVNMHGIWYRFQNITTVTYNTVLQITAMFAAVFVSILRNLCSPIQEQMTLTSQLFNWIIQKDSKAAIPSLDLTNPSPICSLQLTESVGVATQSKYDSQKELQVTRQCKTTLIYPLGCSCLMYQESNSLLLNLYCSKSFLWNNHMRISTHCKNV